MRHDRQIRRRMLVVLACCVMFVACNAAAHPSHATHIAPSTVNRAQSTFVRVIIRPDFQVHGADPLTPLVLQALRDSMVSIALSQLGTPYVFGGATPKTGFDCSGLVRYAMSQVHMSIPRTAAQQSRAGTPVERDRLERGDLLAFGTDSGVTHIGIYVGAGRFVHASSVAGKVIVSPVDRVPSPLIRPMKSARRVGALTG
jgi:hypothetical protein